MYLLQTEIAPGVDEIVFILSLIITALFYSGYRKYEQQLEKEEMLDNFLKD